MLKGQAPPSEAARSAGEGAFFEHEQSVKNPYNFGMEILAEQGTPVAVWGAGNLFPSKYHNKILERKSNASEQVFWFGCYKVTPIKEFPAKTKAELRDIMNKYKGAYASVLSYSNLHFCLKPHHGYYKLVPVNYPRRVDGYRHMEIDERDNCRPTFDIPSNMLFDKTFGMENVREFDKTSMLMKWFHNGGIHTFVNHKYVHKLPSGRRTKSSLDWEGGDGLAT